MKFQDLVYEVRNGVAWIIINRPDVMNAFRGTTCDELIKALYKAGYDKSVGCIVLTGAGDRAFCTGGDQSTHDGNYDGRGTIGLVGEKKAREIWYMCRRYSGKEAEAMGLANLCVPHEELDKTVQAWGEELCERSPTAIGIAKRSFNMDTAHQAGIAGMGMYALKLYYDTDESREGVTALKEKRKPDFRKFAK